MLEARLKELAARGQVPPEVQEGRSGIAALIEQEMKARKQRMEQDRAEAIRRREEAIKSAPGVLDPEGLLRMASMIDPSRKGTAFRGISRGAAEVMAGQRAARQGAEKEYQDFMRLQRAEENALSQMRLLEAQRLQALREGDVGKAQQAQDAIYATRMEFDKIRQDRQDKQREIEIAEERNQIAREGVDVQRISATRPTETQQMVELYEKNPEVFKARFGDKEEALMAQLRKSYDDYAVKLPLTATPITFAQYVAQFKEAGKKGPALGTRENPIKLD